MNEKFAEYLKGKSVSLAGVGISNAPLAEKLVKWGASRIVLRDKRSSAELMTKYPVLAQIGAEFVCGEDYLKGIDEDIVIKTPGIRYDTPELLEAAAKGCEITSETELFFEFCPAYKIAVTGSDGKSTTTTLIFEMLKTEGKKRVFLGGNIGEPLLYRINDITADDIVVCELSSFQLHTQKKSPDVAVITNISPNHLDWHKSFDEYKQAKANILAFQDKNGMAVLNADNADSRDYIKDVKGGLRMFSRKQNVLQGACMIDGIIRFDGKEVMRSEDIKLVGEHNRENYMAAICAVRDLVSDETIRSVAKSFAGVQHRLQLIREKDGVKFYNSSIDSSPSRTNAALSSFEGKNVIIILGGKDKKVPFDSLSKELAAKTKLAVLTGAAMEKIYSDVANTDEYKEGKINFVKIPEFDDAVRYAASQAESGDFVVLSPACTSFDRFANFEQRGNYFTQIVNSL